MTLFEEVQTLSNKVDYDILLEPEEGEWCEYLGEVYWHTGRVIYNGDIKEGIHNQDGCSFINIDNGSGFTITKVFLTENRVTSEEFEDKYEGQMHG